MKLLEHIVDRNESEVLVSVALQELSAKGSMKADRVGVKMSGRFAEASGLAVGWPDMTSWTDQS